MKVRGLNGRDYNIHTHDYVVKPDSSRDRSSHHLRARELLSELYSSYTILEEVKLPGSTQVGKRGYLYLDFLIPLAKIAIEVHGRQHYEFVFHFHKTKAGFLQSQYRDHQKKEWCKLNDIELIELNYEHDTEQWRQQITGRS